MVDRIVIPRIPVRAFVGVRAEEREVEQDIRVSLGLELDLARAGADDDLALTVDYEAVCAAVAEVVGARAFHLIEAVAEEVAAAVLGGFAVASVEVRVEKPGALEHRGVPFAAVEIRRGRDG